eukprot:6390931-Pyramimonas_sp.AAC.1
MMGRSWGTRMRLWSSRSASFLAASSLSPRARTCVRPGKLSKKSKMDFGMAPSPYRACMMDHL